MQALSCPPLEGCLDLVMDAVCVVDENGRFLYVSSAAERIFGYSPSEMLGRPMIELVHPDDRERTLDTARRIMEHQPQAGFENRYVRKNGQVVHIMWSARWSEQDRVRVAVARDISARKRAEAMQAAVYAISEATHVSHDVPELCAQIHGIVAGLLPANRLAVSLQDPDASTIVAYDVTQRTVHGAAADARLAVNCFDRLRRAGPTAQCCHDVEPVCLCEPLRTETALVGIVLVQRHADDRHYTSEDRELMRYISRQIAAAIERKQLHARLRQSAFHDPLTGLPNRALLQDRLQSAIVRAQRDNSGFTLLFIDMDKFKDINDLHGHLVGDHVLVSVARRLEGCVRRSDTVARLGGDEFVIVLDQVDNDDQAAQVVGKIRRAFEAPLDVAGLSLELCPSIGSAGYPLDGENERQLLAHADAAMYAAKHLQQPL